ncbi:hypothetical protein KEJ17_01480 [Candidatus Bathyarchaeota archaeon]|nr:hypothetical protein [Candidatus Bathyarchaeota archaeon]
MDDGTLLPLSSISSITSIIGGFQSQEIFKLLIDREGNKLKSLAGKVLYYMGRANYITVVDVERRKGCICNDFY